MDGEKLQDGKQLQDGNATEGLGRSAWDTIAAGNEPGQPSVSNDPRTDVSDDVAQDADGAQRKRSGCVDSLVIVGVGASSGGLEAFRAMLQHVPVCDDIAFVLVQHLSPTVPSLLAELLAPETGMRVIEATDGIRIEGGCVYVITPDATLALQDGHLQVTHPAPPRALRWPIDTFFSSLAQEQGQCAVAVVLAGNGNDGARGLQAIKDYGGLTIAQAGYDHVAMSGMPASAAATGLVDDVLPAEEIGDRLLAHCRYVRNNRARVNGEQLREDVTPLLDELFAQLRRDVGHDFAHYKQQTVIRRVQRRMQVLQIDSPEEYVARVRRDPAEVQHLFAELLISVTEFFRDPAAFSALQVHAIPQLVARRGHGQSIRVWVPGCATGQEAYTIAILLSEALQETVHAPQVQIFATDIDEKAIAVARAGRYRAPLAGIEGERLRRWFIKDGEEYCVTKSIREMCIFSLHSAIKDPPFSRLDLISCRNLMIYFNTDLQERLLRVFHYALQPGAHLLLGPSESPSRSASLFDVVDKKQRLYRKKGEPLPALAPMRGSLVAAAAPPLYPSLRPLVSLAPSSDSVDLAARRVMEKYSPAYVVLDAQHNIVRFGGNTGRYLDPSSGAASLNLFNLLQRSLRTPTRQLLQQVKANERAATREGLWVTVGGHHHPLQLIAEPLTVHGDQKLWLLGFSEFVRLEDAGVPVVSQQPLEAEAAEREQGLLQELETTRHQLHSAIDQLETMAEEMKSVSEEYQSVNEELQSTNEELETSREELQSINEELQTVNAELQGKNEVLGRVNSDLQNLMESTQIATLFLDGELRIAGFTPAATDIFYLRSMDRGRPITDITSRIAYETLADDVAKVLRTLEVMERVLGDDNATYLMRMRPYRTVDNKIDGVVMTFIDITQHQRDEIERARLAAIVDSSSDAIFSQRMDGVVTSWNHAAELLFGRPANVALGHPLAHVLPEAHGLPLEPSETVVEAEFTFERDDRMTEISAIASPIHDATGRLIGVATIARDITERRQQDLAQSETRFAALINQASVGVAQLDLEGRVLLVNPCFCSIVGRDADSLKMVRFSELDKAPLALEAALKRVVDNDASEELEHLLVKPTGDSLCVRSAINVVRDHGARARHIIVITSDISEQREIQRHLAMMLDELNHRVKNTLATVQAVALQTLSRSPDPQDFRDAFLSRLGALSQTHNLLAKDVWSGVWLRQLVRSQLAPYGENRFDLQGEDLKLSPKTALALSMAFHELTTNAAKYGALVSPKGCVHVGWRVVHGPAGDRLRIEWSEHSGRRVTEPQGTGFGTRLITRGLAHELAAEVDLAYPETGVTCSIEFSLDAEPHP
jgi:two-component system CheB/CheR fusion protein